MSDVSRRGGRINHSSPSSRVSNTGENWDLHKQLEGLDESMKLIMDALNIGGWTTEESQMKT